MKGGTKSVSSGQPERTTLARPSRAPRGKVVGDGAPPQELRPYADSILDAMHEPAVVIDDDLRIRWANQPFCTLFQLPDQEVRGRPLGDVGADVWMLPTLRRRLKRVLRSGAAMESFEVPYRSDALGQRALLVSARTLPHDGASPDSVVVAIDDVTERRRMGDLLRQEDVRRREEAQIRQRQLELTNAMRASTVGELATGLAHELNQPLASISNVVEACAQYLRAGTVDPPKLLELLSQAATDSMRAAAVVARLRSCVDKGQTQREPVELGEIVGNLPRLLLWELDRQRIVLRVRLPAGRLHVDADRIQIEQVIVNLIQNAIDSIQEADGPQRLIELSVRSAHGMGEVSVRDTGTGVSEPAAERMFEAFFTTRTRGLGIGLALSRSILEAHRGRIWMEAPPGGGPGTVVRFSIPTKSPQRRRKDRTV
ncbi:MAG: PAS domain-containing protein [Deltaproteobacteria bacterium]|nr:PAS domain-containing protein [Deltaproteobacteria bacterium]